MANGYMELLQELGDVKKQCLQNIGKDDMAVLDAYHGLRSLSLRLGPLQDAAELAAPNLVDFVRTTTTELRQRIEKGFAFQLEAVLKKINWPSPAVAIPDSLYNDFQSAVRKLLDLQVPDLEAQDQTNSSTQQPLVLLPFKVMVQPLELGFRYHFEGDKPTNRLDHPEYWLSHITDKLLIQHSDFIQDYVQPLLSQAFRGSTIALNPSYIDATSAFITSLLPMLRTKIFATLPKVENQPQLLSHLIHETMNFDETLRNEWSYSGNGSSNITRWQGLTSEILGADPWFAKWLSIEKEFALARYRDIIEAADGFTLDFDSVGPASSTGTAKTVPTKAAIRVNDLLETVTDHYRTLTDFHHKLRFLIDVQISIFDAFHARLADALTSFTTRTTLVGRSSRSEQEMLLGVQGLESLARIYGSAEYLEKAMRDWSDDLFFLELWDELQARAGAPATNFTPDLPLALVASKTSAAIAHGNGNGNGNGTSNADTDTDSALAASAPPQGALFDETAAAYGALRAKVEAQLTALAAHNARRSLAGYERANPWPHVSPPPPAADSAPAPSAELDPLLATLAAHLGFLARVLAPAPLRRVARAAVRAAEDLVFEHVVLRRSFSAAGAEQLAADVAAVRAVVAKYAGAAAAESGVARLEEAVALLRVPVRGSGGAGDDGDGEEGGKALGLREVEKMLFQSGGEDARRFLVDQMGIERLSVSDARKVLARKLDLGV